MNGDGSRTAQIATGAFVLLVAAGLLLLHYTAGHEPRDLELYIGAGGLVVGAWLVAPVGMGGLVEQAREAAPFLDGESDG